MTIEEAVEQTINECIAEGILADFLEKNRKEAVEVCIFEYNEELVIQDIRKDEFRLGKEEGIVKGLEQGLEQGIEQGETRLAQLNKRLIMDNKIAELQKASEDAEYRKKLYIEYNI